MYFLLSLQLLQRKKWRHTPYWHLPPNALVILRTCEETAPTTHQHAYDDDKTQCTKYTMQMQHNAQQTQQYTQYTTQYNTQCTTMHNNTITTMHNNTITTQQHNNTTTQQHNNTTTHNNNITLQPQYNNTTTTTTTIQ